MHFYTSVTITRQMVLRLLIGTAIGLLFVAWYMMPCSHLWIGLVGCV